MIPAIISLADARAAGLKFYYPGPCKYGHTVQRKVADRSCPECAKDRARKYEASEKGKAHRAKQRGATEYRAGRKLYAQQYSQRPGARENKRLWAKDWRRRPAVRERGRRSRRERRAILGSSVWRRGLLHKVRERAKKLGLDFDRVAVRELLANPPSHCPILGTEFKPGNGPHRLRPSVDRIRLDRGYVRGNIAIISVRANSIKNDATSAEIRAIADWLDRVRSVKP